MLAQVWEYLWPEAAEQEPQFQAETERLGRRGLRVIGAIQISMPAIGAVAHFLPTGAPWLEYFYLPMLISVALGVATRWSANSWWGSRHARLVGICSGFGSMTLETWSELHYVAAGLRHQMSGGLGALLVLLVGITVLPLKPWHTFALGAGCSVIYLRFSDWALASGWVPPAATNDLAFTSLPLVVLMCTALTAVSYHRIYSIYLSHRRALDAADELRRSESHKLVAENAASMGRLAAAVSHELNSPLGAVRSAAESLRVLAPRLADAGPADAERFRNLADKLCGILIGSAARMSDIVARIQRVSNLDRAEVQSVDLNQLVGDVIELVSDQFDGNVQIEKRFAELPPVRCSPQPLSAAVSGLLWQAVRAAPSGGSIRVGTERGRSGVDIVIVSLVPLVSGEDVGHLFDPKFQVRSGRVGVADWSMVGARRLIFEQGGNIQTSRQDHEVRITIPLPSAG